MKIFLAPFMLMMSASVAFGYSIFSEGPMVGDRAPDFVAAYTNGERFQLSDFKGHPVLLSFIAVHNSSDASQAQGTRAQLTFLRSMIQQYGDKGLKLMVVTEGNDLNLPSGEMFLNFIYDNQLSDTPVVDDSSTSEARIKDIYNVHLIPTTFLISGDGRISQRWNNVVLPAQMAFTVETELAQAGNDQMNRWPTPAQAVFPGLPPARLVSKGIWLIDGGTDWEPSTAVRLMMRVDPGSNIILDIRNPDGVTEGHLIFYPQALPKDESGVLSSNLTGPDSILYSDVTIVPLLETGNYKVCMQSPGTRVSECIKIHVR